MNEKIKDPSLKTLQTIDKDSSQVKRAIKIRSKVSQK